MSTAPANPTPNPTPTPPVPPHAQLRREPPLRVILEKGGAFSRFGTRLAWILVVVLVIAVVYLASGYASYMQLNPQIDEKFYALNQFGTDKIAIITVAGTIMHADGFAKWQIDQARKDPNVKGVVVRVDSPGGTITGSHYLYHHLLKLQQEKSAGGETFPLVVSMGGLAASGGYYISMAVGNTPNTIFAEPTTWTGSIGVVIPHYDVSSLLESWKIEDDSIASHPLKLMGSPTRKPSEEVAAKEREILQQLVSDSFEGFKDIVKSGRPAFAANPKKLDEVATGQIFSAKQALKLGLVDKFGFVEDAADRAIELAGLNRENVRVVKYLKRKGLVEQALELPSARSGSLELGTLLDLTTPRAYYLCTWLPAVAATGTAN
jgi:protease-4